MEVATVGVIGGGQLAQMMVAPAKRLGLRLVVLDPDAQCSASTVADEAIVGQLDDYDALKKLASISDVLTFEIERAGVPALKQLQVEGHQIFPSPEVLETIQDKLTQKQFLVSAGVPTSELCRRHGFSEASFYARLRKHGVMGVSDARFDEHWFLNPVHARSILEAWRTGYDE